MLIGNTLIVNLILLYIYLLVSRGDVTSAKPSFACDQKYAQLYGELGLRTIALMVDFRLDDCNDAVLFLKQVV